MACRTGRGRRSSLSTRAASSTPADKMTPAGPLTALGGGDARREVDPAGAKFLAAPGYHLRRKATSVAGPQRGIVRPSANPRNRRSSTLGPLGVRFHLLAVRGYTSSNKRLPALTPRGLFVVTILSPPGPCVDATRSRMGARLPPAARCEGNQCPRSYSPRRHSTARHPFRSRSMTPSQRAVGRPNPMSAQTTRPKSAPSPPPPTYA